MFTHTHSRLQAGMRERGLSLIEMVVFIVIVSIGATSVLMVMNLNTRHSADPLRQKQALAIAEALLEEVELMPFTDCDPDGFNTVSSTCEMTEARGPEAAYPAPGNAIQTADEARGSTVASFDNVNDYDGFILNAGDRDLPNEVDGKVVVPAGYTASVAVTNDTAFGVAGSRLPGPDVLRIAVTVSYGEGSVAVEGYRTKYAPTVTP
jgi:MSHA pilin protein MshD